jgi:hypothetical protein
MATSSQFENFKNSAFPILITGIAIMIWYDITEMKSDIKTLIAQGSADHIRIESLERQTYKTTASYPTEIPKEPILLTRVAVLPDSKLKSKKYDF